MSSQTSSTSKSSKSRAKRPRSSHHNPSTSNSTPPFTERMQDAQARDKDYYDETSDDSPWEGPEGRFNAYGRDTYTNVKLRREAAVVLDNPELLMMHAQARNDSLPGTRLHFTKQLCGYTEEMKNSKMLADREMQMQKLKERYGGKGKWA